MRTFSLKGGDIRRQWLVIDAADQTLGRLAARIARLLRGKHKPTYSPHLEMGDYVIVVNAAQVRVTGKKLRDKVYYRHSGYHGGLKSVTLGELMATRPTRVIEIAVQGMLPHNRLGRKLLRNLKVYAGPEHPHEAQVKGSQKEHGAPSEGASS
ncbi:MAG: 50S ribosomal protein L13 [Dehalococcoidia bacterium]